MSNPLDEALDLLGFEESELEKEGFARRRKPSTNLSPRAQQELQMWNDWNASGRDPNKLRPLIHSLQPLVKHRSRIFVNKIRDIPPPVIEAEFQDQLVGALETYNPKKSQLKTWVTNRLIKANRFINTYQNPARIGEKRIYDITKMQTAEERLQNQLGREPSDMEISDFSKMPLNEVRTLRQEVRKSYPSGHFGPVDPMTFTPSRTKEVMKLLPYDLSPEENAVFDLVYTGRGGKGMGTGDIAKKLKMSAPKVSRLKKAIAKKWGEYENG